MFWSFVWLGYGLQEMIPNSKIQKIMELWGHVEHTQICNRQFYFSTEIHFKGVKPISENSVIFLFYFIPREL